MILPSTVTERIIKGTRPTIQLANSDWSGHVAHEDWYTKAANDIRPGVPVSILMTSYKLSEADLAAFDQDSC